MPPPKTGAPYKPVPPPKPKNYRPPLAPDGGGGGGNGSWGYGSGPPPQPCGDGDPTVAALLKQQTTYQHAKSYSVAGGLDAAGCIPQHNGGNYIYLYRVPYFSESNMTLNARRPLLFLSKINTKVKNK